MPALKNVRYEAFAQQLYQGLSLKGLSARSNYAAYTRAGYTAHKPSARVQACRLLQNCPAILERVHELMGDISKVVTPESIVEELEAARALAETNGQASAMVSASLGKGKILGLEPPQKTEIGKPGEFDFASAKTSEQIARGYLQQHTGLPSEVITPDMVKMTCQELKRHSAVLECIATGQGEKPVIPKDPLIRPNSDSTIPRQH